MIMTDLFLLKMKRLKRVLQIGEITNVLVMIKVICVQLVI